MAQREIVVNAAVARVWAFITALRYLPLWLDGVTSVQPAAAITQSGTQFAIVRAGQHGPPETWIVADWEPPRHVRYTEYRRNVQLVFRLSPLDQQTRVHATLDAPTVSGVLARLLPDRSGAALDRSLARLHEICMLNRDIRLLRGVGDE